MSAPRVPVGMLGDPGRLTLRSLAASGPRAPKDHAEATYLRSLVRDGLASVTDGVYALTPDGQETYEASRRIYG